MGRMAKNRKVEKSAETVWLNMVFQTHLKIKIGKTQVRFQHHTTRLFVGHSLVVGGVAPCFFLCALNMLNN